MRILIAEDDLVTRELLKRILSHMADDIIEANDGLEALELIEREDPDFLFTDLQMPELDGKALVQSVRASKEHSMLPIVCMSAVKDKDEITELVALGIQDYILKPIRPAEVHDRFRKVIAQHSGWRRRQVAEGRRTLLLVDPDPNFRAFSKPFLEGHFTVLEAISGAHALRLFKESEVKPNVVLVARGLPLVGEVQLQTFIGKLADGMQINAPMFWLCSDDEKLPPEAKEFAGHVRRSFVPETFTAELKRTLLHGATPADQLADYLKSHAQSWVVSATRQTLGVMFGQEVRTLKEKAAGQIVAGVSARIALTAHELRLRLLIASSREDAFALTRKVLRRGDDFEDEQAAADVFGELANTIGGRARAALVERNFDLNLGLPSIATDYANDVDATWDLQEWFETATGSRFFVGLVADDGTGPDDRPATAGVITDASVDDALF